MGKKFLKKILLSLISLAVCCPILSSFAATDDMRLQGMGLLVKDGVVLKYTGESSELVIPGNLGIVGIGEYAFRGCESLVSVVIPYGVKYIGDGAFSFCVNLQKIELPDSLETIGNGVFSVTYSLESISIPSSVTSMGENIFSRGKFAPTKVYGSIGSAAHEYVKNRNLYGREFVHYKQEFWVRAVPNEIAICVNGQNSTITVFNIGGNNYFRLRSIAGFLTETDKSFNVEYEASKSSAYDNAIVIYPNAKYVHEAGAGENEKPVQDDVVYAPLGSTRDAAPQILVCREGERTPVENIEFVTIHGYNYFKLRDVARLIDFGVSYDGEKRVIHIDTDSGYFD